MHGDDKIAYWNWKCSCNDGYEGKFCNYAIESEDDDSENECREPPQVIKPDGSIRPDDSDDLCASAKKLKNGVKLSWSECGNGESEESWDYEEYQPEEDNEDDNEDDNGDDNGDNNEDDNGDDNGDENGDNNGDENGDENWGDNGNSTNEDGNGSSERMRPAQPNYGYIKSQGRDGKFCWTIRNVRRAKSANLHLTKCRDLERQRFVIHGNRIWLHHRSPNGQRYCVVFEGPESKPKTRKCYAGFA